MEDLGALLDEHVCDVRCSRTTHTQAVSVEPADVASVAAELATLRGVLELLTARNLRMLEGEPTPRFGAGESGTKEWSVRYQAVAPATGRSRKRSARRGWWSRILDPQG